MYYRLKSHCALIEGAARGAIYDFRSGKVLSVNRGAVELLTACQQAPLDTLLDLQDPAVRPYLTFLDTLARRNLGSYYALNPPAAASQSEYVPAATLDFLWLEITSCCNNRCLHCYTASSPALQQGCVPHERWLSLISEAREQGATALQLIGGEPLLYPKWRELIGKAAEEAYDYIEIFTNATLIDEDCIRFFKHHNLYLATTIYAASADIHDRVTGNQGSFDKTMTAIKKILAAGIPLRIASILMKANETEAQNIIQLCRELGLPDTVPDVIRPTGRGDDDGLLPRHYHRPPVRPPFYTDRDSFRLAHFSHSCLSGKIAITADGDVLPCIFARDRIAGNILNRPLREVLSGAVLQETWNTTKDAIIKCRDCEYRYACSDCRPLAQSTDPDKRWCAPSPYCDYNPYTGQWN
ncbi:radical SAM/SPASM domain-containing protein [Propionispora vibrioides]|uniref:Radical SAM additional 4Fe4S-binding SPASM domain-containing protein n=1 Tax=Propionispora vibrioides TaxID=112903 RepID=A0A1H8XWH8_9FIRM|nr:radical SAM protein [Propionispora vibrioides]SEP44121.1 radical SAM additional 4Fe4S-binding SPASM domain-containing protein [Propionispora vibrioides]